MASRYRFGTRVFCLLTGWSACLGWACAAEIVVTTTTQVIDVPGAEFIPEDPDGRSGLYVAESLQIEDLPGSDGLVSLSEALIAANNTPGDDTIVLAEGALYEIGTPNNHWYGPNALPPITSTIVIEGNGATLARSGSSPMRFFFVNGNHHSGGEGKVAVAAGDLTLRRLSLRDGRAEGGKGGNGGSLVFNGRLTASGGGGGALGAGGALFSQGAVTLEACSLHGNTARGGDGGGRVGSDNAFYMSGASGGGMGAAGSNYANLDLTGSVTVGGGFFGSGFLGGEAGGIGGISVFGGNGGPPSTFSGAPAGGGGGGFGPADAAKDAQGVNGGGDSGADQSVPGGGAFGGGGGGRDVSYPASQTGGSGGGVGGGGSGGGANFLPGGQGGFGGGGGGAPIVGFASNNNTVRGGRGGFGGGAGGGGADGVTGVQWYSGAGNPGFGGGQGGNGGDGAGGGGGGAGMGGAIFNHGGSLRIVNSTFTGNRAIGGDAAAGGGGNAYGGAVFSMNGVLDIEASTLAGNSVQRGTGLAWGDQAWGGAVAIMGEYCGDGVGACPAQDNLSGIVASILSDSVFPNGGMDDFTRLSGSASADSADGASIVGSGWWGGTGTPRSGSANLTALADNGGPTLTMAPQPGSPALDSVACDDLPSTDQRGAVRPDPASGSAMPCDVGAVEAASAYVLQVSVSGNGAVDGDVASGISDCRAAGGGCTGSATAGPAPHPTITLVATADSGWQFVQWSGDCNGSDASVPVTMDRSRQCSASFAPLSMDVFADGFEDE